MKEPISLDYKRQVKQTLKYLEDAEAQKRDAELALALLEGTDRQDKHGLPYIEFLSSDAENDGREALCRLLECGVVPGEVQIVLAEVFEPRGHSPLKAVLKRRTQGHPTHVSRDIQIACRVYNLRKKGEKNAVAKVAKEIGKDARNVAIQQVSRGLRKIYRGPAALEAIVRKRLFGSN